MYSKHSLAVLVPLGLLLRSVNLLQVSNYLPSLNLREFVALTLNTTPSSVNNKPLTLTMSTSLSALAQAVDPQPRTSP